MPMVTKLRSYRPILDIIIFMIESGMIDQCEKFILVRCQQSRYFLTLAYKRSRCNSFTSVIYINGHRNIRQRKNFDSVNGNKKITKNGNG